MPSTPRKSGLCAGGCGRIKVLVARGRCGACYTRLRREENPEWYAAWLAQNRERAKAERRTLTKQEKKAKNDYNRHRYATDPAYRSRILRQQQGYRAKRRVPWSVKAARVLDEMLAVQAAGAMLDGLLPQPTVVVHEEAGMWRNADGQFRFGCRCGTVWRSRSGLNGHIERIANAVGGVLRPEVGVENA